MVYQKGSSARLPSCHVSGHRCHWRQRPIARPRRDSPADRSVALEAAEKWLKEAQTACDIVISPSTSSFLQLQSLLKHLNAADEASVQIWCELCGGSEKELCDLEGRLRQKAIDIFEVVKFDLARHSNRSNPHLPGSNSSNPLLRADLLRPSFGSVSCMEIWETLSGSTADSPILAKLSGCAEEDAARLIRFGCRLSELFAPIELTKHLARQDWTKVPYASGAALLPALDQVVRELQMSGTKDVKVKVAIFGSSGCQLAAAAHRLGCESTLAEPRVLLRACLQRLFEHNQVTCTVGEGADPTADVFVVAFDEDGLVEWGQLQLIRRHLRKAEPGRMPRLIPERIIIKAALIDDTLPRIRGCQLNRFERMRGFYLRVSHRWPKGACHIHPQFRSNSQVIYDFTLSDFVADADALDRTHLSFLPQPGSISGVAYWVTVPGLPEEFDEAWIRCIQPLPVRRVEVGSVKTLHLWANFSDVKLWFDWAEDDCETTVVPPLGKTKLPPWHFKMLNDHQRNRGYHQAISRAVQRKMPGALRLLDCGCGAGLLSLLASREGGPSLEITAVELSPLISDVTQEVFGASRASQASQLKLVTGDVRSLRPEEVGRYDIIVSELMDASGLGESLLSVLEHACRDLASPGAQVIPCGLRLIGALGWLTLPNCHGSFDFSSLDALNFCSRVGGPFSKENPPSCLHVGHDLPSLHSGPFTSRNLNRLRRGEAWDLLTEEETLLTVDFREALAGKSLYPCSTEVDLVASTDGVANCLLWWWEVQLDEMENLSNRPMALGGRYGTHWHQPLLPLGPMRVTKGDRFRLEVKISDAVGQKLSFTLKAAEPGSASAWQPSMRLPSDPLMPLLKNWQKELEEACAENTALTSKFTSKGDLKGLAQLQRAVLVLSLMPRAFGCDPFIRDRLLQSYFGVAYK